MKIWKICSVLLLMCLIVGSGALAQSLDRVSISSGTDDNDELSYVIGETFSFVFSGGNTIIETGSHGSTDNTGGAVSVEEIVFESTMNCYPNPVKDILYFNINRGFDSNVYILILDNCGKLVLKSETYWNEIMSCNVKNLPKGNYIINLANKKREVLGISKFIKL